MKKVCLLITLIFVGSFLVGCSGTSDTAAMKVSINKDGVKEDIIVKNVPNDITDSERLKLISDELSSQGLKISNTGPLLKDDPSSCCVFSIACGAWVNGMETCSGKQASCFCAPACCVIDARPAD